MRNILIVALLTMTTFALACDEIDLEELGLETDDEAAEESESVEVADDSQPQADRERDSASPPVEDDGDRHYEPGEFSYVPPEGWSEESQPGVNYAVMVGPTVGLAAATIVFDSEPTMGDYDDYVDRSLDELEMLIPEFELNEKRQITTEAGQEVTVLDTNSFQQNMDMEQHLYLFDGDGSTRYAGACTLTPDHDEEIVELCDETMKTFRVE